MHAQEIQADATHSLLVLQTYGTSASEKSLKRSPGQDQTDPVDLNFALRVQEKMQTPATHSTGPSENSKADLWWHLLILDYLMLRATTRTAVLKPNSGKIIDRLPYAGNP